MIDRLQTNRWLRAAVVAAVVAIWPACSVERDIPEALAPRMDLVLKNADGQDVRLADFKGRPLVVNLWATWCGPCRAEIPWFVEFAEKYKDQNLAIIGISYDDTPEDILKFAAEYKVNYPMLVGRGHDEVVTSYSPEGILPATWLIRPDGSVLAKVQGIHPKSWFEENIQALF